ncbi:MAG: 30S ribosomal protein S6 [Candidatus Moranbacteria bacterium]|nr:30S ribosomal protein S6 [Candidatus Moranbacteria bacterium]
MLYELCYLVGESNEPKLEEIKKEVAAIVTQTGGIFQEPQIIEKRKMSYKIKGQFRGTYAAQRFEIPEKDFSEQKPGEANAIQAITKKLNLDQNILRFIIVKTDDLPELRPKEIAPREKVVAAPVKRKDKEKTAPAKSIDEKLEEILNI